MPFTIPENALDSTVRSSFASVARLLNPDISAGYLISDLVVGLDQPTLLTRSPHSTAPASADSPSTEIRGTQWNDLNGNGLQDQGESGLAGWTSI